MDPFATLGIERAFDIDLVMVAKRHRDLSRTLHPDRHAAGGATERRMALSKAIEVNEAFRIVKDPIRRAESLFQLSGVAVGEASEPKADPELLMEMMERREGLAEARAAGDLAAARRLAGEVTARASAAERSLADGLGAAAGDPEALRPLLHRLGELRFYRRFLDEVSELEDTATEDARRATVVTGA